MKKIILIIVMVVVVAAIVLLLMNNKATIEKRAKSTVRLDTVPVTVTKVQVSPLDESLVLVGIAMAEKEVNIVSETQGRIVALYFDVGKNVSTGSVLAKADDELKQASFNIAEANYDKAKKDLERYKVLNKEKSVNDVQLEQAIVTFKSAESQYITTKRQLEDTKIKSPISGVVTSRNVEVGTYVSTNTPIANVVQISSLKVKVNVAEKDVFKMKPGDKVIISTDVYPDVNYSGTIKNINSKADEAHTFPVEIELKNNSKYPLKAGMFVNCIFNSIKSSESRVIPRVALVGSIKSPQVYVVENSTAKLRNIVIGTVYTDVIQVLDGLQTGDNVVTSGQINLQENSTVKIVR
ncbi:MAG: efflux RND transporter periplasmic adaptor subunit [Ignavibacteriae bacterium]|nr:efflux RND transporter periplasmic adaptor subunit [Ignavibacteriota bacterium]